MTTESMRCELDGADEIRPIGSVGSSPRIVEGPVRKDLDDRAVTARIFNIQRFSTEDGPGIRTTVFLKGCPLTCPWCANPESQAGAAEVAHSDPLCDHCNRCVQVCDKQAISINPEGGVHINRAVCDDCGKCIPVCGPAALRLLGDEYTVDQVFDEIKKDATYYSNSNGGVTCSGGEPLSQARFVAALFKRCQDAGMHTTLDTCGSAPRRALERVIEYTDLVLFDFKIFDPTAHRAIVGAPIQQILDNAKYIVSKGVRLIARMPLIPGYTDSDENVSAFAGFIKTLGAYIPVNILPYHRFGMNKYQMLDRSYEPGDLKPPSSERVQSVVDRVRSFGLECEIVT
jgi:pyruvate formate lyase activating enzyme